MTTSFDFDSIVFELSLEPVSQLEEMYENTEDWIPEEMKNWISENQERSVQLYHDAIQVALYYKTRSR